MGRLDRRVQELLAEEDGHYGTSLATTFPVIINARELPPRSTKGKRWVYVVSMRQRLSIGNSVRAASWKDRGLNNNRGVLKR